MLEDQRKEIDRIDQEIVMLFELRCQAIEAIAELKLKNKIAVLDQDREKQVIAKVQSFLSDDSLKEEIADLYQNLMRISRFHQTKWIKKREKSQES